MVSCFAAPRDDGDGGYVPMKAVGEHGDDDQGHQDRHAGDGERPGGHGDDDAVAHQPPCGWVCVDVRVAGGPCPGRGASGLAAGGDAMRRRSREGAWQADLPGGDGDGWQDGGGRARAAGGRGGDWVMSGGHQDDGAGWWVSDDQLNAG